MTDASAVYVPPVIEHSEWDKTVDRIKLFAITRPATEADVAAWELEAAALPEDEDIDRPRPIVGEPLDQWYTMPGKPHPGLGLAFLKASRAMGVELAMSWLFEEVVGADGYEALAAEPGLTLEDLTSIMSKVRRTVLGGLAPKAG